MKYYEVTNVVLIILLVGGLYLPTVKKLVKNNLVLNIFLVLSVIPFLGFPIYSVAMVLPLVYRDTPTMARLFTVMTGLTSWSILFKMIHFHCNRNNYEQLIYSWDVFSKDVLYPELKKEILLKMKKTTDRWVIAFEILLSSSGVLFSVAPFFTRRVDHTTAMPYSTASPDFEIFITYEFILHVYFCLLVHAYNSFLMQNVALEEASCEYLRRCLGIILNYLQVGVKGEISFNPPIDYNSAFKKTMSYREICHRTEKDLKIWVRQHQNLMKFHNKLRAIYHIPLCVEFTVLVVIICIITFMIITNSLSPAMTFISVVYCITTYTIFYVSCYYGDLTGTESTCLHGDALSKTWYLYPKELQTNLLFIITKCRTSMTLVAFNIYPLNSGSFAKIFRHSYSFFMFLLQVMNRSKGGNTP